MKSKQELRDLSEGELKSRKIELQKELLKMNVQVATGTNPQNSGKIRLIKKNVARIITLLKQKEDKE